MTKKPTDEEAAAAAAQAKADEEAAAAAAQAKADEEAAAAAQAEEDPLDRLKRLAEDIEARAHHHVTADALVADLKAEEGLALTESGPWTVAELAGLTAESQAGAQGALRNWAVAARRALQEAAWPR